MNVEKIISNKNVCILNSNAYNNKNQQNIIAFGCKKEITTHSLQNLQRFIDENPNEWFFGYLTYDVKNEIENLQSKNIENLYFPQIHFFIPETVVETKDQFQYKSNFSDTNATINSRETKDSYLKKVKKLQHHIQRGDIYEINFCQEFYAEFCDIDAFLLYQTLNKKSPTPFSCYYKNNNQHLICASPERFLKKEGTKLLSEPIKGTISNQRNPKELLNSVKERSENVMIVDLVRNDLSRVAKKNSVKVEELFGIYSFQQVHQMISTVSCEIEKNKSFTDIIKATFPMGSMTGAPKIRAMQLIEEFESSKRGLYSGSVGYIKPNGDFDFNVVIRSILYNELNKYLSFSVGGAITALSNPKDEYEECLLKAKAIFEVLNSKKS